MRRKQHREVVYVERGGIPPSSGCSGGRLSAPGGPVIRTESGEETRRNLQRKLWKFRAMTEEKLDEITQQFGGAKERQGKWRTRRTSPGGGQARAAGEARPSPRQELERRLAEARARRRHRPTSRSRSPDVGQGRRVASFARRLPGPYPPGRG